MGFTGLGYPLGGCLSVELPQLFLYFSLLLTSTDNF